MKLSTKPLYDSLSIVRLSRTDWRVSDTASSPLLLGFIERQNASRFEITWMSDPIRWGYAASFEDALTAFADSTRFTGEILAERDRTVETVATVSGRQAHRATWLKRGKTPTAV